MRNANPTPFLRPATKDALFVGLFWLLIAASCVGGYLTTSHFLTWTSQHFR